MKTPCRLAQVAAVAMLLLSPEAVSADLGALVASESVDGVRVSVFASPNPIRRGPVEWTVFVGGGATSSEPSILMRVRALERPAHEHSSHTQRGADAGSGRPVATQGGVMSMPTPSMTHEPSLMEDTALQKVNGAYRGTSLINAVGRLDVTLLIARDGGAQSLRFPIAVVDADVWTAHWPALIFPWAILSAYALRLKLLDRSVRPG